MSATIHTGDGSRVAPATRLAVVLVTLLLVLRLLLVSGGEEPVEWGDLIASLAFSAIGLAIGLVVVLPRAERAETDTAATAALVLGVLALLALPLFWFSGAPFALGASAVVLARSLPGREGSSRRRAAAIGIGAFVVAVSLLVAIASTVSGFHPALPQ